MNKPIVIISGVTKGLGRALVREFQKQGWKVVGCGRSSELISQLQNEYGDEHSFSVVDVTQDASVAQWADEVLEKMGSPKMVINNAALINRPDFLWKFNSSELSGIIQTNVIGTFNVLRHFIPSMIKQKEGLIVNVSSG